LITRLGRWLDADPGVKARIRSADVLPEGTSGNMELSFAFH
jgi:hypothetical protein